MIYLKISHIALAASLMLNCFLSAGCGPSSLAGKIGPADRSVHRSRTASRRTVQFNLFDVLSPQTRRNVEELHQIVAAYEDLASQEKKAEAAIYAVFRELKGLTKGNFELRKIRRQLKHDGSFVSPETMRCPAGFILGDFDRFKACYQIACDLQLKQQAVVARKSSADAEVRARIPVVEDGMRRASIPVDPTVWPPVLPAVVEDAESTE